MLGAIFDFFYHLFYDGFETSEYYAFSWADINVTFLGQETTLADYLCHICSLVSIILILVLCCLFVYKIIKLIGGLIR